LASLNDNVNANIARVKSARGQALSLLNAGFFITDAEKNAMGSINGMPIDAWAARGTAALASGKPPDGLGWAGWVQAGQVYIDGIFDVAKMGKADTLLNITQEVDAYIAKLASPVTVPVKIVKDLTAAAPSVSDMEDLALSAASMVGAAHERSVRYIGGVMVVSAMALAAVLVLLRSK
jgi:hypothetical protein